MHIAIIIEQLGTYVWISYNSRVPVKPSEGAKVSSGIRLAALVLKWNEEDSTSESKNSVHELWKLLRRPDSYGYMRMTMVLKVI